jgi:hypothetical protein
MQTLGVARYVTTQPSMNSTPEKATVLCRKSRAVAPPVYMGPNSLILVAVLFHGVSVAPPDPLVPLCVGRVSPVHVAVWFRPARIFVPLRA